jgi:hypothetical protein
MQLKLYIQRSYEESRINLVNLRFRRSATQKTSRASKPQAFTFASMNKYITYLENYELPELFNGFLALFQNAKPKIRPFPFTTYTISRSVPLPNGAQLPHYMSSKQKGFIEISDALDPAVWHLYYTIVK